VGKWKAHAAVLLANLFFGINFSSVKHITHGHIGPFGLNVIRVGVTSLLLWIPAFFSNKRKGIHKKDIIRFMACALTGILINQSFFIKGLSMTLSIHASLLILITPVFISIGAVWSGSEPMSAFKAGGLAAAVSGAVMLSTHQTSDSSATSIFWGDIFIIINAVSYSFYFAWVQPLMRTYEPLHVIRWIFTFGLLFTLPVGWDQFAQINWTQFTWVEYTQTSFIVIGATFLAYLFNLYGIHHIGPSLTGTYIYTQPVFATIIAISFLGENFGWYQLAATFLIISGVLLVSRSPIQSKT
jgi:drug/metabolite transporter (DMT)-like permease